MKLTQETMKWFDVKEYEPPFGEMVALAGGVGRFRGWVKAIYVGKGKYQKPEVPCFEAYDDATHFMIPADPLGVQELDEGKEGE
jgi:hypothetical protein